MFLNDSGLNYIVLCNSIEGMHTFYTDREKKQGTILSGHGENLFPSGILMNKTR